jgi:hypothetical protein
MILLIKSDLTLWKDREPFGEVASVGSLQQTVNLLPLVVGSSILSFPTNFTLWKDRDFINLNKENKMFKVGDRVGYSSEDYDQDEIGIIEEVINNDIEYVNTPGLFNLADDNPDVCYAIHWQIADFSSTIHHSMIKLK